MLKINLESCSSLQKTGLKMKMMIRGNKPSVFSPQRRARGPSGRHRPRPAAVGPAIHHRQVRVREDVCSARPAVRPGGADLPGAAAVHQLERC